MGIPMSKKTSFLISFFALVITANAFAGESVQSWVGIVEDLSGYHDPDHQGKHDLKFTRSSDGESFYITVGDEELQKQHLSSDKTMAVKIDGRITSKFLFFGGNLVVERFEKLADVAPITHKPYAHLRENRSEMGRRNR